jgi:hypothetical protein
MYNGMNVAFLGSGRCFHTNDWYRSALQLLRRPIPYITDNYEGDDLPCLLKSDDDVRELFIIDRLVSSRSSKLGHLWRNVLKLALTPLQVLRLRRQWRALGKPFIIAHSTYYAFLASFIGARYSSTPQGSEVLVRTGSRSYRWLLGRSLRHASFITVDSQAMKDAIARLTDRPVFIVQNGINIGAVRKLQGQERDLVMSVRAISPNYRTREIVAGRDSSAPDVSLTFTFPFTEETYFEEVGAEIAGSDSMLGRVEKDHLLALLGRAICIVSIPESDSSPRSVYEAIFAGAAALCAPSPYIEALPDCMRARIVVVDLGDDDWFAKGVAQAREIVRTGYAPSEDALSAFDQLRSMGKYLDLVERFAQGTAASAHVQAAA